MRSGILSKDQIDRLAEAYLSNTLLQLEGDRCSGIGVPQGPGEVRYRLSENEDKVKMLRSALMHNLTGIVTEELTAYLESTQCIEVNTETPEFRQLAREVIKKKIEVVKIESERLQGNYCNGYDDRVVPVASPQVIPSTLQVTEEKLKPRLSDLWTAYRASKVARGRWTEGTAERIDGQYAQVSDILTDCELVELEDEAKAVYLAEMLQKYPAQKEKSAAFGGRPFTPKMAEHPDFKTLSVSSINKCIDLASSLMKYAMENRKKWGIDFNPFAKSQLSDSRPESELREVYEDADLKGLVAALQQEQPHKEPENLWVPLLGLFTGARQNELCQLRCEDVKEVDGIHYLEIRHRPELNQSTKTRKDRTVPLHPVLVELGFLEYVKGVPQERLWPNLQLHKGKWQHAFSKRYNRTVRERIKEAGGKEVDFHSLRHTFLNWFKQHLELSFHNAKLLKSLAGHLDKFDTALIGAVQDDITFDRYGKDYKVKRQWELIKQLDYGVDLGPLKSHLEKYR